PAQPSKPIVTAAVTAAAGGAKRVHATLDGAQPITAKAAAAPKGAPQQDDASVDTAKQSHGEHSELGA
ncbi:lytic transglycosylase domain-containing protein, partial [Burkholderia territorii]